MSSSKLEGEISISLYQVDITIANGVLYKLGLSLVSSSAFFWTVQDFGRHIFKIEVLILPPYSTLIQEG